MIKPREEGEEEGSQGDQEEEEEEEPSKEDPGLSNYHSVSREKPEGTAGQERALRRGTGVGVRGGPGAGEKARPAHPESQPELAQPGSGSGGRKTYKEVLCNSPVGRRITRSMT